MQNRDLSILTPIQYRFKKSLFKLPIIYFLLFFRITPTLYIYTYTVYTNYNEK